MIRYVDNKHKFSAVVDSRQVSEVPLPARHRVERHGAIRLGTGHEMRIIARCQGSSAVVLGKSC